MRPSTRRRESVDRIASSGYVQVTRARERKRDGVMEEESMEEGLKDRREEVSE